MKLTNTQNMKATKSGMTLLELTVVILVLLSLISILFIGARAWKKGSDRAASILQIRNVQQAVRSYSNMNNKNAGDTVATLKADIFGAGKFIENDPTVAGGHPAGTGYVFAIATETLIPAIGVLYMQTGGTPPTGGEAITYYDPEAATVSDW
ncbi:MAG: prepilin-type N-terminal cleavage/methylation domain-containing protein [Luteolibacter sp.]